MVTVLSELIYTGLHQPYQPQLPSALYMLSICYAAFATHQDQRNGRATRIIISSKAVRVKVISKQDLQGLIFLPRAEREGSNRGLYPGSF